jgi:hypothetical protein
VCAADRKRAAAAAAGAERPPAEEEEGVKGTGSAWPLTMRKRLAVGSMRNAAVKSNLKICLTSDAASVSAEREDGGG